MIYGIRGNHSIQSNTESATYTCVEFVLGSNPTLTARKESLA